MSAQGRSAEGATEQVAPIFSSGVRVTSCLPLDMQGLVKFDRMIDDLVLISPMNAPMYMRDFLNAKEVASEYYCQCIFEYEQARDRSKKIWSVCKLDRAPEAIKNRGLRLNEATQDAVSDSDPEFLKARESEAYWKALSKFFEHKVEKFQCAHDDVKKIFDHMRDPRGSTSAMPSGR